MGENVNKGKVTMFYFPVLDQKKSTSNEKVRKNPLGKKNIDPIFRKVNEGHKIKNVGQISSKLNEGDKIKNFCPIFKKVNEGDEKNKPKRHRPLAGKLFF